MGTQDVYIFEVRQKDFNTSVILNSNHHPVFVLFMGMWSEHCLVMASYLETLAQEFAGQFVLAKIDIDEQKALRDQYEIQNVPTLKVFRDGDVVFTMEGLMQQDELRDVLKGYGIYHPSDEMRMQARQQHMAGNTVEAIQLLTQAIQQDPNNTRVAMDMVQVFIDIGQIDQAKSLYNRLPEKDRSSETGISLMGQLTIQDITADTAGRQQLEQRVAENEADHDARFDLALCYIAEHDYERAMECLFVIYEQQPDYREGAANELIIKLIDTFAPNNPEGAQAYRRRLGAVQH